MKAPHCHVPRRKMAATTRKWAVALWALTATLGAQLHSARSEESNTHAPQQADRTTAKSEPSAGPLPQTCEAPAHKDSLLTIRIRLTAEAFSRVAFDHPKPAAALPAGVIGQSLICACVDNGGNLKDPVKLLRGSGSPVLDTEALEIGKTLDYPAGHPGCMHDTINFAGPND
jgi:outer membrane biosynthesis protein TonB